MGKHTIDLSAEAELRLQSLVDEQNARDKTALTLDDWLIARVQQWAINKELATKISEITEQKQAQADADIQVAIEAEKTHLLDIIK